MTQLKLSLKTSPTVTPWLKNVTSLLNLTAQNLTAEVQTQINQNPFLCWENEMQDPLAFPTDPSMEDYEEDLRFQNFDVPVERVYQKTIPSMHFQDPFETMIHRPSPLAHIEMMLYAQFPHAPSQDIALRLFSFLDSYGFIEKTWSSHFTKNEIPLAKTILAQMQTWDPLGIFSQSIHDFFKIQVANDPQSPLYAMDLIPTLHNKKMFLHQCKKFNLSLIQAQNVRNYLGRLHRRPFYDSSPGFIFPEILITQEKNFFKASLNPAAFPKIALNFDYYHCVNSKKLPKKDHHFIQNNLAQARNFIHLLHQREKTILKISQTIVNVQKKFFFNKTLEPLILKDISQSTGYNESTISRAINEKYLQYEGNIFPLKHFFSHSHGSDSYYNIQQFIQSLIKKETFPLSDRMLCTLLKNHDIHVARRTIAKYREELRIPSSRQRSLKKDLV